ICRLHNFFFQAEDGIRDRNVTGVQTCALPISYICKPLKILIMKIAIGNDHAGTNYKEKIKETLEKREIEVKNFGTNNTDSVDYRSEERRVGKECKNRWVW